MMEAQANIEISEQLLADFCSLISTRMGLYFPPVRWKELKKKLIPAMQASGYLNLAEYLKWLLLNELNQDQIHLLAHFLTIGETYFFRETEFFEILRNEILPEIISKHKTDRRIRIWSAGCCTGEEPYSIAILLRVLIPNINEWDVKILGTDINPEFLNKAKLAQYKRWSFRNTPETLIKRYFTKSTDQKFVLDPKISKMVTFEYLNLADLVYPSNETTFADIDLILCHNVFIYFSQEKINRSVDYFTNALAVGGLLSVAAIERSFVSNPQIMACNFSNNIVFQKTEKQASKYNSEDLITALINKTTSKTKKERKSISQSSLKSTNDNQSSNANPKEIKKEYPLLAQLYKKRNYPELISKLIKLLDPLKDQPPVLNQYHKEIYLLIRSYANQGDITKSKEWCELALSSNKIDPNLHYLYAIILWAEGQTDKALKSFRDSLFLDPDFTASHYMLGLLMKQQGKRKEALNHFKTALDLLDQNGNDNFVLGNDELSSEKLKDLLTSCLTDIKKYPK